VEFSYFVGLGLPLRKLARNLIVKGRVDVVHVHGIWSLSNHWVVRLAAHLGIPVVLHLRGMLEPWALRESSIKKKIALALYQRRDIELASLLVATSEDEVINVRCAGFDNPVAMIPNGVACPREKIDFCNNSGSNLHTVLFLSRIHPKKGLLNLVRAWSMTLCSGWKLKIVGPDHDGHLVELKRLARSLGVLDSIEFCDEADENSKWEYYSSADLFVLPTFSENFGVVVAEALASGIPVITTKEAPWKSIEEQNCGWWIDVGVEPLAETLQLAMSLADSERFAMGERGVMLSKQFDWDQIAEKTIEAYQWVLRGGVDPDFIDVS